MPIRHARSETRGRPPFGRQKWNWQERFDKIPQWIWKPRGGHTRSGYLADADQASEVLLRALREIGDLPLSPERRVGFGRPSRRRRFEGPADYVPFTIDLGDVYGLTGLVARQRDQFRDRHNPLRNGQERNEVSSARKILLRSGLLGIERSSDSPRSQRSG